MLVLTKFKIVTFTDIYVNIYLFNSCKLDKKTENIDNQDKKIKTSVVRSAIFDEMKMVKKVLSLHPDAWKDLAFYLYKQDNKKNGTVKLTDMKQEVPVQKYKYTIVDGKKTKVLDENVGTETIMDQYIRKAERALQSNKNKTGIYIGNKYTEKVIKWSLMYVQKEGTKIQTTKLKVNTAMRKFLQL